MDLRGVADACRSLGVLAGALLVAGLLPVAAQTTREPQNGGTLVMALSTEPSSLVGLLTTAADTYYISGKVTEGLLEYGWDGKLVGELATAWDVSADGKTITFKLRDGVRWHDGTPFGAEDVKFSIETLQARHPRGRVTFANVTAIETPDPLTVVLKLSQPAPYLLPALAGPESPMVPKHVYDGSEVAQSKNNAAPVGTGPFKFQEWVKGDHVTLVRNDKYWKPGLPHLDRIIVRFIVNASARASALEAGEVDIAPGNPVALYDLARLGALPNLSIEDKGDEYSSIVARIEFNLDNPYLKNLKVRQAIVHAIDKNFIQKRIWFGYADITDGPIHPRLTSFYTPDIPGYEFNPKLSEKLLDEAGFPRKEGGVRFKLVHDYLPLTDVFQRTAEYVKQALRVVGIDVEIRGQDFPTYVKRIYTDRQFDFVSNWMNNTPDPTLGVQRLYWSKNFKPGTPFSNGSHYSSDAADKLLEAAQSENDPAERTRLWHELAKVVVADLPDYNLVGINRVTVYNKKVRDHTLSPLGVADSMALTWIAK